MLSFYYQTKRIIQMLKKTLTISAIVAVVTAGSFARGHHGGGHHSGDNTQQITVELSDTQKDGLVFMAEEEKVARDVYLHLAKSWGVAVFSNIAKSEQRYMDAVERLLGRYELKIPSTIETEGKFENQELQSLYDELIIKGDTSLIDAILEELLDQEIPRDGDRLDFYL
jgi:hypothetical protein